MSRGAPRALVVASALAGVLAASPAWAHRFPEVRTVVVQVEACEVALLVGYRPSVESGQPGAMRSMGIEGLRKQLAAEALQPLTIEADGVRLLPTDVRTKMTVEPGLDRPMILLLVTFRLPPARRFAVHSAQPRTTRISWTDRASHRVDLDHVPSQNHFFDGVASLLLDLLPPGGLCGTRSNSVPLRSAR